MDQSHKGTGGATMWWWPTFSNLFYWYREERSDAKKTKL